MSLKLASLITANGWLGWAFLLGFRVFFRHHQPTGLKNERQDRPSINIFNDVYRF